MYNIIYASIAKYFLANILQTQVRGSGGKQKQTLTRTIRRAKSYYRIYNVCTV